MEFNTKNPDWIVKNVGDLQTAVEMNDVIDALKKNADVLQNLINKVYPNILLKTNAQLISKAINELHDSISTIVGFNITTKTLTDSQVYYFPAMSKGEAFIIKIIDPDYIPAPSGAVWLGGYGGVLTGDGSMVICLTNSPGGTYNDVGHNFAIINQGKDSEVLFVDELPDEHLARTGVIYVLNSNNAMYIWDQQLGDYVLVGDVIPGTLISSTVFEDENNNVVVPEANKLYFDTTTEIYYRWDGVQYVSINSNTFAHLNDQKYVKYDESTGRLESGKISETSEGIGVNGDVRAKAFLGRATAHDISTAFLIDANDLSEMYHLNLTGHTNIEITNRTNGLTGIVTAWAKGTYNLNFVNLVHEEDSSLGYDGTMWNLIVMEWSDTASHNLGTWKVVSQMPI